MPAALTLAYPFAVWLGGHVIEPRLLACGVLAALAVRIFTVKERGGIKLVIAVAALLLAVLALLSNAWLPLKLYPVLVNAGMLALFTYSLRFPPSAIERIARLQEPDLPAHGVAYTRRVTQVWCVFFLLNGSIALATALWMTSDIWALYNGVIAYALMGLLFAGEYAVRLRFKRRHHV